MLKEIAVLKEVCRREQLKLRREIALIPAMYLECADRCARELVSQGFTDVGQPIASLDIRDTKSVGLCLVWQLQFDSSKFSDAIEDIEFLCRKKKFAALFDEGLVEPEAAWTHGMLHQGRDFRRVLSRWESEFAIAFDESVVEPTRQKSLMIESVVSAVLALEYPFCFDTSSTIGSGQVTPPIDSSQHHSDFDP